MTSSSHMWRRVSARDTGWHPQFPHGAKLYVSFGRGLSNTKQPCFTPAIPSCPSWGVCLRVLAPNSDAATTNGRGTGLNVLSLTRAAIAAVIVVPQLVVTENLCGTPVLFPWRGERRASCRRSGDDRTAARRPTDLWRDGAFGHVSGPPE